MRRSFALLLTFAFLAIAIGIISSLFIFYKNVTNKSFEYSIAQDSFIINSLKNEFLINLNKSNIYSYYGGFIFDTGEYKIKINIKPVFNRININRYLVNGKINKEMDRFFDLVCESYNINECSFFKDLVLDTLDEDDVERDFYTEIKNYKLFRNGRIDKKMFLEIIKFYEEKTKEKIDKKILNIFGFRYNIYSDINVLNKEVLLLIENLNKQKLGIIPIKKMNFYYIKVLVDYKYSKFSFIYDIVNKRIISIKKEMIF